MHLLFHQILSFIYHIFNFKLSEEKKKYFAIAQKSAILHSETINNRQKGL